MTSSEPSQIGKYDVLARIAQGGMAEIFLAKQRGIGGFSRRVVLKCILPLLAEEPRFVKMFMEEARLASQIHHPNVVQIFDVGEEDESFFIAMEYIDGLSVGSMLIDKHGEPRSLPIPVAGEIVVQVCAGLHAAHKLTGEDGTPINLVHRDISPPNLMVSRDGVVKLVDFGIAKAVDSSVTTRTGNIKGKYAYMSPEQVRGLPLDRRSDLFSLGTVFYELLTGERLFHRNAALAILVAILDEDFPSAHETNPKVPEVLSDVLLRALERDREARFKTAAEMGNTVREVLGKLGHYTSSETLTSYLENECADQLNQRKAVQLDIETPSVSRRKAVFVPLGGAVDPRQQTSRPRADNWVDSDPNSRAQPPDIINLPPSKRMNQEEYAQAVIDAERSGVNSKWLEEPTIQSMKPLHEDPDDWQEQPFLEALPDSSFLDEDDEEEIGEEQTAVAPIPPEGESSDPNQYDVLIDEPRFIEPTVDFGPQEVVQEFDVSSLEEAQAKGWIQVVEQEPERSGAAVDSGNDTALPQGNAPSPTEKTPGLKSRERPGSDTRNRFQILKGWKDRSLVPLLLLALVVTTSVIATFFYFTTGRDARPSGPPLFYAHPPSYRIETLRKGFGPLARYLEKEMDRPIEIATTSSYEMLQEKLISGEIHFANLPPLLFVSARSVDPGIKVLAVHAFEGTQTDQSYIIARDDSGVRTIEDLRGRPFCYPDPRSTTGYLMPRRYLRSKGMNPDELFSKSHFSRGHVGVMEDIIAGRCDAGAVISSAWLNARDLGIKSSRIRLVAAAGDATRDVICASPKLPSSLTESLRRALLNFNAQRDLGSNSVSPFFAIDRFAKIRDDQFSAIEEAARAEKIITDR